MSTAPSTLTDNPPMTSVSTFGEPLFRAGCRVAEARLPSGMRVIVGERHTDPVVAVMVFYGVGSVHEAPETAGVSHFLEHMMFKGTTARGKGEVDRLTALLGGQNNAYTGKDHTAYWFEFASDRWEEALAIEADRMSNLALDPKEFEAEREVVLEELAMGDDDPWRALSESVEAAACGEHAYGRPIIGYEESVGALTRERMFEHYRRAYAPSNATVVVCGDVRADEALRAVERAFAGAARVVPPLPKPPPLAFTHTPQRIDVTWPDSAKRLCIAWPGARCGTPDDAALDFVQTILTAGRNALLTRELVVDGGLASNVSAANDARAHGGLFWLFAECADAVEPAQLEEAVFAAIERLASEGPSAPQMERAFGILVAGDLFESESISDVADQIGGYALDADWRLALDGGEALRHVTVDDVRSVAVRLLARSRATVGWCLPGAASEAGADGDGDADADDSAGDDDSEFGTGLPIGGAFA